MVGPGRPMFVLFGSSIVQQSFSIGGWGAILSNDYSRRADVICRGYCGWNSRRAVQVLDKIFPKEGATQPSLVIVLFGGNEPMGPHSSGLSPNVPLEEYIENMRKIAIHLKSISKNIHVMFLSCPPINEVKLHEKASQCLSTIGQTNELCQLYSEACIKLCKEMDMTVVDLFTAIQKREDWLNTCFTDGIHFSAEGSKIVAEEIVKVLNESCLKRDSMAIEFSEDSPYDLVAADGKSTINLAKFI